MEAKILIDDSSGRFKAGETGYLLEHDSEKYDYYIDFGTMPISQFSIPFKGYSEKIIRRRYYFFKDEVELIKEN